MLRKEGIDVAIGRNAERVTKNVQLCVYTIAISQDHPELVRARELGVRTLTYPEALGELTKTKKTIAVCGTHGKTTTTAMTYHALKACGVNPTVIVGSLLKGAGLNATEGSVASSDQAKLGVGSNFIPGDSEYMVVEACEYRRSFLNLEPTHILLTNIDEDHLDYYKDRADIDDAFQSFMDKLPEQGFCITHSDVTLIPKFGRKCNADQVPRDGVELLVLGEHNQTNAQLVITLLKELGLPEDKIREGLLQFTGTWRRLEVRGDYKGVILYDDYGHHPTEIKATLAALRQKYTKDEYDITAVFQPHLFSRTKLLLNDFAESFEDATHVYVLPIYKAREVDDGTISSEHLVRKIYHAESVSDFKVLQEKLELLTASPKKQVFITVGAGDVYRFYDALPVVH
jgi:UDP-N-acetylmuramate--alanine ligase